MFCFFFFSFWTRFWGSNVLNLHSSSCWTYEQKSGPYASQKTTHCKSRAHFRLVFSFFSNPVIEVTTKITKLLQFAKMIERILIFLFNTFIYIKKQYVDFWLWFSWERLSLQEMSGSARNRQFLSQIWDFCNILQENVWYVLFLHDSCMQYLGVRLEYTGNWISAKWQTDGLFQNHDFKTSIVTWLLFEKLAAIATQQAELDAEMKFGKIRFQKSLGALFSQKQKSLSSSCHAILGN